MYLIQHFVPLMSMTFRPPIGSALPVLESLAKEGNKYDFIYVDCQKSEYCDYFKVTI